MFSNAEPCRRGSIMKATIQAHRSAGGLCPPDFRFCPPDFFLAPHGIFLGGRSCCFWAEKTLKFAISARKSLRISAKTFFFCCRSPAFGRKICDFGKKNSAGKNLCPPDFNFAPPSPDLAKLATPLPPSDPCIWVA